MLMFIPFRWWLELQSNKRCIFATIPKGFEKGYSLTFGKESWDRRDHSGRGTQSLLVPIRNEQRCVVVEKADLLPRIAAIDPKLWRQQPLHGSSQFPLAPRPPNAPHLSGPLPPTLNSTTTPHGHRPTLSNPPP